MRSTRVHRVLVTGSDGYIGTVLCPKLMAAGYDVVGLDTGYYRHCAFDRAVAVPTRTADVRDVVRRDLDGFHAVVHLAALSNDPLGAISPDSTLAINHLATAALARRAREAGVRRFLFASSCSVYGKSDAVAVDEDSGIAPLTAYADSKLRSERDLVGLTDERFCPVILRCATVYGVAPQLRLDLVVNNLTAWGVTAGEVRILSDGTPWRPLIHVDDLAAAYVRFLEIPEDDVRGLILNVGFDEQNYRVREIAEAVSRALPGTAVTFGAEPPADSRSYRVAFDRFRARVGVKAEWDLESGVAQLVTAYRARGLTPETFAGPRYVRVRTLERLLAEGRLDADLRWGRR